MAARDNGYLKHLKLSQLAKPNSKNHFCGGKLSQSLS
jgi:hypothetical protein